jgi:hypothetical protein
MIMNTPRTKRFALLPTLALATSLGAAPVAAITEQEAIDAVEAFMAGWNSRSPEAFAATLQYPHVRPTARGGEAVHPDAQRYAATVDFEAAVATGWHHSVYDSLRVLHLGSDKAHVAGTYTRFREDGSKIWSNQVTYVVTRDDSGATGVRARFAAGLTLEPGDERDQAEAAAIAVVERYMEAFNARDEDAWADTFNYPHLRVASGGVTEWKTAAEYTDFFDFERFAQRYGWHHSGWDSLEAVQVSADGVNVSLVFSRFDAEGRKISTFDTLYLVTKQNGRWGVRARSSFAP